MARQRFRKLGAGSTPLFIAEQVFFRQLMGYPYAVTGQAVDTDGAFPFDRPGKRVHDATGGCESKVIFQGDVMGEGYRAILLFGRSQRYGYRAYGAVVPQQVIA